MSTIQQSELLQQIQRRIDEGNLSERQRRIAEQLRERGFLPDPSSPAGSAPAAPEPPRPRVTKEQADLLRRIEERALRGGLSEKQQGIVDALRERGYLSQPDPADINPFDRVLEEGGVSQPDRARLLQAGVTPENAAEYAAAHIQERRAEGIPLSEGRQRAIFDLYKRMAGRTDTSDADFYQRARTQQIEAREDLPYSAGWAVSALNAWNQNMGTTGANFVSLVAPETGERLRENVAATYDYRSPSAGFVGNVGAELAKLVATGGGTGLLGAAGLYGLQGAGGQRGNVARLRAEGNEVSGLAEAGTAAGVGAVEGLSGMASLGIARALGRVFRGASPTVRAAAAKGEPGAVRTMVSKGLAAVGGSTAEGTEELITQYTSNAINSGIDPEQALTEGLAQAFAMGAVLAPFGGAAMSQIQATRAAETPTLSSLLAEAKQQQERAKLPESTPQAVPPRTQAERELIGETGTAEPTLGEEARFVRGGRRGEPANPRSTFDRADGEPVSEPRAIVENRLTGQPFEGPQATNPRRRRKSKAYPEGFDERTMVLRDEAAPAKKKRKSKPPTTKPKLSTLGRVPSHETAAYAAAASPKENIHDPAELGAEIEYFEEMVAHMRNGQDDFVQVRVPITRLNTLNTPDAATVDRYARRSPRTAPPVVAGVLTGERKLTVIDGKHRVAAAKARGEKTVPTMMPVSDAVRLGFVVDDSFTATETVAAPPNQSLQMAAVEYATSRDLPSPVHAPEPINPLTARRLARAYDDMVHDPADPNVRESYDRFQEETLDQFNALKAKGYVFELAPVDQVAERYPTVAELAADLRTNRRLVVNEDPGDMPADHPMMAIAPGTGGLTYNQVFRAVHDIHGHAAHGYPFSISGEENAWRAHSQMYSDLARGAMTTETRGQSTWVGYGPNRVENRQHIENGEIGKVTFPPQKAALLPPSFWTAPGLRPISEDAKSGGTQQTRWERATETVTKSARRARASVMATPPSEGTAHKRRVPQTLEDWITPLASRVHDLSKRVYGRLMRMESDTAVRRERIKAVATPLVKRIVSALDNADADKTARRRFKDRVLNGDREGAREILRGIDSTLVPDLDNLFASLDLLLADQRDAGVSIGEVADYWPRRIKDYAAFKELFGDDTGPFEEAWELARRTKGKQYLTEAEKIEIANKVIQGFGPIKPGSYGPPHARSRRIQEVPDDALDYYVDPFEAYFSYVDAATYAAERSRFLGKNASLENLEESVGAIIEAEAANLSSDEQAELRDLLVTRFTADMLVTSKAIRTFKQLVYISTLGQFRSTLVQLSDSAITAAEHGISATVRGLARTFRLTEADRKVIMEEIGVHSHGEEFRDVGRIAQTTDWVLWATGFKAMDRLGKETRINAARVAFERAAANPDGREAARFRRDYEEVMGDEAFRNAMTAFRTGRLNEDARYLLFLDITRVQPLTTSQMPAKYLEMRNGRVLYTLKTFTVAQLNHVRRDMVRKILTPGQRREGLAHLGRYLVYFTLIGLGVDWVKDWLRGQATVDSFPDRAVNAVLGTVGLNRYTVEKAYSDPVDAAINYVAPPLSWITYGTQDVTSEAEGIRSIRNIPIVGELLYYWAPFGRGSYLNEEAATRDYRAKLKDLRQEAAKALEADDVDLARKLLAIYNERRKEGPGDGRERPLTLRNLRGDIRRREARDDE